MPGDRFRGAFLIESVTVTLRGDYDLSKDSALLSARRHKMVSGYRTGRGGPNDRTQRSTTLAAPREIALEGKEVMMQYYEELSEEAFAGVRKRLKQSGHRSKVEKHVGPAQESFTSPSRSNAKLSR